MRRSPPPRLATSLLALAAAACGGPMSGQGGASGADSPAQRVGATATIDSAATLFHSSRTGYGEPTTLVVRDRAAWEAAWARLHGGETPAAPPAVDFAREMVLLVALGERSSGGHDVTIDAVAPDGSGGATVAYTAREPGEGCMSTQALTSPAVAVRAARVAGAVRFERRVARPPCQ